MRKSIGKIGRGVLVVLAATVLVSIAINASDSARRIGTPFLAMLFSEPRELSRCPEDMVFISSAAGGFCIDSYENSPSEGCSFAWPARQTETRTNLETENCRPISRAGALPWTNISQNQALAACAKVGKRLPTAEEWYRAALGTSDKGGDFFLADCNLFDNWGGGAGKTGSGVRCLSAAGAYDMVGNVWEWVAETATDGNFEGRTLPTDGFVAEVDERGMPTRTVSTGPDPNYNADYFSIVGEATRGVMRGGYWLSQTDGGIFASNGTFMPSIVGEAVGFRCAQ